MAQPRERRIHRIGSCERLRRRRDPDRARGQGCRAVQPDGNFEDEAAAAADEEVTWEAITCATRVAPPSPPARWFGARRRQ